MHRRPLTADATFRRALVAALAVIAVIASLNGVAGWAWKWAGTALVAGAFVAAAAVEAVLT
jgi:hypothetical protein